MYVYVTLFQEMEPRIAEICSNLIGRLEENDKEIAALMARIQNDEVHIAEPGPEVVKLFSCSTQLSMKFQYLINAKIAKIS